MKKFIRTTILASLIALAFDCASAQDYRTGIGFRAGGLTSGITVKHFIAPDAALEGIMSFGYRTFIITGLYEQHVDINTAPGLKWLYGGGAHLGFFRYGGYYYLVAHGNGSRVYYVDEEGATAVVGGLDFILGLDYKFNRAPFNIGLDIKPFIDFVDGVSGYFDGAISFRFAF